ncbi:16S rRNA (cytidine(1402)-2'-O)-methyltransferase [hydrothermal vent metagenome]|uniref:16S rRNA (Cytidine(1402)-2'-O)-methyltransferase n=1 Tax=hydrothermal vent metagenome TaxID=652676 RepID=A0A3B0R549_9ZZZZ
MPTVNSSLPEFVIEGHKISARPIEAGLHITATPIGNMADITLRALNTLAAADLILCEDTRITSRLLQRYQIITPMKPYHDHNGAKVRPKVIEDIRAGKAIALVSDAGTPLISDPGFKLVHELRGCNLPVHMSPGVSAPIMALALCAFPSDKFQFCGFLPPKSAARCTVLAQTAGYHGVSLFFESPKRIERCLADAVKTIPDAQIAIGRELTKRFEEVMTGSPAQLLEEISQRGGIKGEITLAIWPGTAEIVEIDDERVTLALQEAVQSMPAAKAALEVAKMYGLQKRQLYDKAVQLKNAGKE